MTEELEVLLLVAQKLDQADIPYMLGGAMALGFYTEPRMTRDIDIVVDLRQEDAPGVISLFRPDWYLDEGAIFEAINTRRMFNIIYLKYMLKVDVIIRKSTPFDKMAFSRRRQVKLEGQLISVTSLEDLILNKLRWGADSKSAKQAADIASLLQSSEKIDWKYLERWVKELDLETYFNRIRTG